MFIPVDKIQKLRDSARSGDERAKLILAKQMSGEDFSGDLDAFFAEPAPEVAEAKATETVDPVETAVNQETPYQMYLRENELEDTDDVRAEFEQATGNKAEKSEEVEEEDDPLNMEELIADEQHAIETYVKWLNSLLASDVCEEKKALLNQRITKIIEDEKQHIDILKSLEYKKDENIVEDKEIID